MEDILHIEQWSIFKDRVFPIVIAGPCSAETEEQIHIVAKDLKKMDFSVLRAGVWKPRTRPNTFEGVGEKGLEWLRSAKKDFDLIVTVEVANSKHVELALKYGMDILWIGARTTVNPFSIQEIADVLRGTDTPIMIKNPINPDLSLWKGAIERFYQVGLTKIAAIHRGFTSFEKTKYRNVPIWQIPIALKSDLPNISMICDPSHIAGKRDLILPVAQRAIDYDYDGIMVEVHPDPDNAWSDSKQQIKPYILDMIIKEIKIKKQDSDSFDFNNQLEHLRSHIDNIDNEIIDALSARFKIVNQIGQYKRDNNITAFQTRRWLNVFQNQIQAGENLGMDKVFIEQLYRLIHDESLRIQTDIIDKIE